MSTIIFGITPPLPKRCLTCKRPQWQWNEEAKKWDCLNCANPNPMITRYGRGPAGKECGDCVHLRCFRQSATWYKCALREWQTKSGKYPGTRYPGTDHRVHFPACARFEQNLEDGDGD